MPEPYDISPPMATNRDAADNPFTLRDLGEFGLIERIRKRFGHRFDGGVAGIGDDCAVLPFDDTRSLLVTTDMLIEGSHFRREWITPEDLGYKSLAVNLSDISAMGGEPAYAFLSVGLPPDCSLNWIERFFSSAHELCEKYGVKLLGGDTTESSGEVIINYTVAGFARTNRILWRSGAKPGDRLALLGTVGESGAGLRLLQKAGVDLPERFRLLVTAHNRPRLFIEEAQFLGESSHVHAMIDLSDGIASDARHLADASGVTIKADIDQLPLSPLYLQACDEYLWDIPETALASGEDYGLLFTLDGLNADGLSERFNRRFGYRFKIIGTVTEGPPVLQLIRNNKPFELKKTGFDHFKKG